MANKKKQEEPVEEVVVKGHEVAGVALEGEDTPEWQAYHREHTLGYPGYTGHRAGVLGLVTQVDEEAQREASAPASTSSSSSSASQSSSSAGQPSTDKAKSDIEGKS